MNNEIVSNQNDYGDLELSLYKKKIDLDYRKIQHKFGSINKISPDKLDYHQNNLCCKLFKNANKRKIIQLRVQTIDPLVEKYFIDNSGKFFNSSKNKVQHTIKGKHYAMQLGTIPLSSRSKTPTQKTYSYQQTNSLFYQESRTQKMKSSWVHSEQNTCLEIQKACSVQLKEQKKLQGIYQRLRIWNANQYENNFMRPQSCKNQNQRQHQFINEFNENIVKLSSSFKD